MEPLGIFAGAAITGAAFLAGSKLTQADFNKQVESPCIQLAERQILSLENRLELKLKGVDSQLAMLNGRAGVADIDIASNHEDLIQVLEKMEGRLEELEGQLKAILEPPAGEKPGDDRISKLEDWITRAAAPRLNALAPLAQEQERERRDITELQDAVLRSGSRLDDIEALVVSQAASGSQQQLAGIGQQLQYNEQRMLAVIEAVNQLNADLILLKEEVDEPPVAPANSPQAPGVWAPAPMAQREAFGTGGEPLQPVEPLPPLPQAGYPSMNSGIESPNSLVGAPPPDMGGSNTYRGGVTGVDPAEVLRRLRAGAGLNPATVTTPGAPL